MAAAKRGRLGNQERGRADQNISVFTSLCRAKTAKLLQIGTQAIHLPITCRQFPPHDTLEKITLASCGHNRCAGETLQQLPLS